MTHIHVCIFMNAYNNVYIWHVDLYGCADISTPSHIVVSPVSPVVQIMTRKPNNNPINSDNIPILSYVSRCYAMALRGRWLPFAMFYFEVRVT